MKITDKIAQLLGVGLLRDKPVPQLQLIAEGLVVTDQTAIAWYEIATENTDVLGDEHRDAMLDAIVSSVPPILEGRQCHLKVVWGRIDGDQYLAELGDTVTSWDERRANWLDEYEVAERRTLLGVVLDPSRASDAATIARRGADHAVGLPVGRITPREKAWLHGEVRKLGRDLTGTSWRVRLAPVETLAWLHSRELHRETVLPVDGTITGAGLARLTRGRVVPYSDHLAVLGDRGEALHYVSILTLSEFPDQIEVPGTQEWLRTLSDIVRVDGTGSHLSVFVDASVRFTILPTDRARARLKSARDLAKEQRQSAAKHSTGETSADVEETEERLEEALRAQRRDGLRIIDAHPRLIVTGETRDELAANVQAVRSHYDRIGFTATVAADEQRELWLEALPGDQLRVDDLGHTLDAAAFFGSWWWGGCAVGQAPGNRMIGHLAGTTPGIVRSDITSGASRGDATTTVYVGRSGRGKTTALMLGTIDAAMTRKTWTAYVTQKGDDLPIAQAAARSGITSGVVSIGTSHAGAADLFRCFPREQAILPVHRQLQLLTPPHLARAADTTLLTVIEEHANTETFPTTAGVITKMCRAATDEARELGRVLKSLAGTHHGATMLAEPADEGSLLLPAEPGLWVVHIPDLTLPPAKLPIESWDTIHRISIALMRAITMRTLAVSGDLGMRHMRKLVSIPEVHRFLRTTDGSAFLDEVARMGRALNTNLALDLQDVTSIEDHEGLVEQISTLMIFQLTSRPQQDAAARLCGLDEGPEARTMFRRLSVGSSPDEVLHGQCVMRDPSGRVAQIQVTYPDKEIADMLDTTPDETIDDDQLNDDEYDLVGDGYALDDYDYDPKDTAA